MATSIPIPDEAAEKRRQPNKTLLMVLAISMVAIFIVISLAFLRPVFTVLMVILMGLMFGSLLESLVSWVAKKISVPHNLALLLSILSLGAIFSALGWFTAHSASQQLSDLVDQLPTAVSKLQDAMEAHREVFVIQMIQNGLNEIQFTTKIQQLATMAVEALMYLLVIVFMGFYLAARPTLYLQSLVLMTPEPKREIVKQLFRESCGALRWWMAGQLIIMLVTGLISGIGLWLIGAPLPLALGILAGVFQFVPIIGPIAAAVPAILLCLAINPLLAVQVALLYLAIHALEAYFLEPVIQEKVISVPPALLLPMQLLMGTAFGLIGVAISAPICGMLMVILKSLHEHPRHREDPGDRHVLLGA